MPLISSLVSGPECDVDLLELVEAGQNTSSSYSSQDVGASSLHQGHEALVLDHLTETVDGTIVLDSSSGGHHHAPSDGVDGVGHQPGSDGHRPSGEKQIR